MAERYPEWVTVPRYAQMCRVSKNNVIYRRIRNKMMRAIKVDGIYFIDPVAYPPKRKISGLKHAPTSGQHSPRPARVNKLVSVSNFAKQQKLMPDRVLEKIVIDDAYVVIGPLIFVDTEKYKETPFRVERRPRPK